MYNNYNEDEDSYNKNQKKELAKKLAKEGISKLISKIPLKVKLIIIAVVVGFILFLVLFSTISTAPIMLLLFNGSGSGDDSKLSYITEEDNEKFWWPVGGSNVEYKDGIEFATGQPTSLLITSSYNLGREINGHSSPHPAIDIGANGITDHYIIASNRGKVTYVNDTCSNNGSFQDGDQSNCGGGFGNYLIIEHKLSDSDIIYTLYAHLFPKSIKVSAGDIVEQGQIIAKMGNSGNTTGQHLHFQLEIGARSPQNAVDPLEYISKEDPRPINENIIDTSSLNSLTKMLHFWEGGDQYTDGNQCTVYDDGYGFLSVGHGIALKYNVEAFKKYGIDVSDFNAGDKIDKSIVDKVELDVLNSKIESVNNTLKNNNITLEKHQVDALVLRIYNVGNISGFPNAYKEYGDTEALYDNFLSTPCTSNNIYSTGLARRRQAEWDLFHEGIYTYN